MHLLLIHNVLISTGGPGTVKFFCNGVLQVYKKLFPNNQIF